MDESKKRLLNCIQFAIFVLNISLVVLKLVKEGVRTS